MSEEKLEIREQSIRSHSCGSCRRRGVGTPLLRSEEEGGRPQISESEERRWELDSYIPRNGRVRVPDSWI